MQKLGMPVEQTVGMLHGGGIYLRPDHRRQQRANLACEYRARGKRARRAGTSAEAVTIDRTLSNSADLQPAKQLGHNVAAKNQKKPSSATSSGSGRPRPWFFSARSADVSKGTAPMPSIQGVTPARHIPLLNRSRFVINNQQPEATSATSTESPAPTIRDGASTAGHRPPVLHSNVTSPQEPPGATAAVSNTAVASPVDAVSRDSTTLDAGDDAPKPIERDDLAPPPNAAAGTAPSSVRTPEPASESNTTKAAHEPSELEFEGQPRNRRRDRTSGIGCYRARTSDIRKRINELG